MMGESGAMSVLIIRNAKKRSGKPIISKPIKPVLTEVKPKEVKSAKR